MAVIGPFRAAVGLRPLELQNDEPESLDLSLQLRKYFD